MDCDLMKRHLETGGTSRTKWTLDDVVPCCHDRDLVLLHLISRRNCDFSHAPQPMRRSDANRSTLITPIVKESFQHSFHECRGVYTTSPSWIASRGL